MAMYLPNVNNIIKTTSLTFWFINESNTIQISQRSSWFRLNKTHKAHNTLQFLQTGSLADAEGFIVGNEKILMKLHFFIILLYRTATNRENRPMRVITFHV